MARIKHIAIRTADVEKAAAFYREVFGLQQVGVGQNGVYLSDGHINLAILKPRAEAHKGLGIDHLGFQVEDVEATVAKLKERGGSLLTDHSPVAPRDPSIPQSYFEIKCLGPDDQELDISGSGWVGTD
jgi:catechol 2,3-dioxygenase-like lactoylglutathione lyase family enzyme